MARNPKYENRSAASVSRMARTGGVKKGGRRERRAPAKMPRRRRRGGGCEMGWATAMPSSEPSYFRSGRQVLSIIILLCIPVN